MGNAFPSLRYTGAFVDSLLSWFPELALVVCFLGFCCAVLGENRDIAVGECESDELLSLPRYQDPTDRDAKLSAVSLVNRACCGFAAEARYRLVERVVGDSGNRGRVLLVFAPACLTGLDGVRSESVGDSEAVCSRGSRSEAVSDSGPDSSRVGVGGE